jgi:nucleotide-binding universal stress UspA family protein
LHLNEGMLAIRHILVPIDFTETSDRALDSALDLARRLDAKVTVMHAYELPIYGFLDGSLIATVDVATRISVAAQEALNAAIESRKNLGVPLTSILRDGVPWEEIATVAEEGLARALLGSVAENVIRTSTKPVLTIHGPPKK